jgi:uncharacterized RDD family membrane protein YckC
VKRSTFVIVDYEFEDRVTIETPEGVDLQLTLAGIGSRFASAVVDGIIEVVILVALSLLLVGGGSIGLTPENGGFAVALYTVAAFLVIVGYDVAFEVLNSGRTPGKRLNGLRVVREGGEPVTFVSSSIRNILRIIDILPLVYLVGCVSILVSSRNQRIGDLAAGTLVVRERKPAPPAVRPLYVQQPVDVAWDTSGIGAEELAAVRSFLVRRDSLDRDARNQLAHTLAERLRPKVPGVPADVRGERFLEALVADRASRA